MPLLAMLSLKSNKISRGKTFDSLNDALIDLKKKKDQIKLLIDSPNDYIIKNIVLI
jgi:hypothetical protein